MAVVAALAGCGTRLHNPPQNPTGDVSLGIGPITPAGTRTPTSGTAPPVAQPLADAGAPSVPQPQEPPLRGVTTKTGSSRPTGQPSSGPPARVAGPLTIGMAYPNNAAANLSLGLSTSVTSDPKALMRALVSGVNRTGGLAGRKLSVDYYTSNASLADYSTQAASACSYFGEDKHVPVVLDVAYGNKFGMASCLAKHGVADFGLGTSDAVNDNAVGLYASPAGMTSTRRYPAVLAGLKATGYLTPRNKIGVLLEECPDLRRAYERAVRPAAARLGLHIADTAGIGCTTGFASAGPASAATQAAVLRFRSHQVDRILIVSDFEQVALMLLANAAASQGWHPGYMLSSAAQTEVIRHSISKTQWPQLHGVGWSPRLDIDDPHHPLTRADRRCLDLIGKGGIKVSGWQNTYIATTECSLLFFLGAALESSRGDARPDVLMKAVDSLGTTFVAPGVLDGRTSFGPNRHDGPAAVAAFGFVAKCGCLRYTGRSMNVP